MLPITFAKYLFTIFFKSKEKQEYESELEK